MTDRNAVTFERIELDVNGTTTVVLAAGDPPAPPLVFFHGAGTFHGGSSPAWTEEFRVLIPFHPGFGESGDFDGLQRCTTSCSTTPSCSTSSGSSATSTSSASRSAVCSRPASPSSRSTGCAASCCAPGRAAGARVPIDDLFRSRPRSSSAGSSTAWTRSPHLPADPHDVDFTVDRYREMRTTALMLWEHPFDRVVPRWLGRVDIPSLVVWGEEDRLVPPALAAHGPRCCPTRPWRRSPTPATSSSTSPPTPSPPSPSSSADQPPELSASDGPRQAV